MHASLTVNVCITVGEGCPMAYLIGADNQIELSVGSLRDGFDFVFEPVALRAFLAMGAQALAELEAPATPEQTDDRATLSVVTAGGQQA